MLVEIDLSANPPSLLNASHLPLKFRFSNLPPKCGFCGLLGHQASSCRHNKPDVAKPSKGPVQKKEYRPVSKGAIVASDRDSEEGKSLAIEAAGPSYPGTSNAQSVDKVKVVNGLSH